MIALRREGTFKNALACGSAAASSPANRPDRAAAAFCFLTSDVGDLPGPFAGVELVGDTIIYFIVFVCSPLKNCSVCCCGGSQWG